MMLLTLGFSVTIAVLKAKVSSTYLRTASLWFLLIAVYCFADSFSAIIHDDASDALFTMRTRIATIATFMLPFFVIRSVTDEKKAFIALGVSAVALASTVLLTALDIYDFSELGGRTARYESSRIFGVMLPRTSGILNDFGDIASLYSVAAAIFIVFALQGSQDRKGISIVSLALLALISVAAIIPLSRNVWAASAVSLATALFLWGVVQRRRHFFISRFIVISLIFCIVVLVFLSDWIIDSALQMRADSSSARVLQYQLAFDAFLDSPVVGVGVADCRIHGLDVHNVPLLVACRGGLFALLPLLIICIAIPTVLVRDILFGHQSQEQKVNSAVALAGYAGFIVAGLLYPGGGANSNEVTWGMLGFFSAVACRRSLAITSRADGLAKQGRRSALPGWQ